MFSDHVQQAIRQVRELRGRIVENQRFRGYSGKARAAGGIAALLGTFVLALPFFPASPRAHLVMWSLVFAAAVAANYGAVLRWYLQHDPSERDRALLKPTIDAFPPMIVGAILTAALVQQGFYDLLFGSWMCLFGLVNLSGRRVLARAICWLGWYYIICGAYCLLAAPPFTNPWPMGLVFFVGESAGSYILARQRTTSPTAE